MPNLREIAATIADRLDCPVREAADALAIIDARATEDNRSWAYADESERDALGW